MSSLLSTCVSNLVPCTFFWPLYWCIKYVYSCYTATSTPANTFYSPFPGFDEPAVNFQQLVWYILACTPVLRGSTTQGWQFKPLRPNEKVQRDGLKSMRTRGDFTCNKTKKKRISTLSDKLIDFVLNKTVIEDVSYFRDNELGKGYKISTHISYESNTGTPHACNTNQMFKRIKWKSSYVKVH